MNFLKQDFCFSNPDDERFVELRENFDKKSVDCRFKFKQVANETNTLFTIFRDDVNLGDFSFAHNFNDGYCLVGDADGYFFIDICGDAVIDEMLVKSSKDLDKLMKVAPKSVAKYVSKDRFKQLKKAYSDEMAELASSSNQEIDDLIEANSISDKEPLQSL